MVKRALADAGRVDARPVGSAGASCPSTARSCGCSPAAPSGAGEAEIAANPRAASVRLRAAERIRRAS